MTERRRDPVTGDYTIFATDRQERTFLPPSELCPLCPMRSGEQPTEIPRDDFEIAVFDNQFPALRARPPDPAVVGDDLFHVEPATGAAEVVVYTSSHTATLASLPVSRVTQLVEVWAHRYAELGARPEIAYVFPFENKGEAIGVTLHHPHGQVYGYPDIPPRVAHELRGAREHHRRRGTCVWCDVVREEALAGARVVAEGARFIAYVPFAARYPYEVHLCAKQHDRDLLDLDRAARADLAGVLSEVLRRYDALYGFSLPYVLSVHQRPTDEGDWHDISHLHLELTPLHRTSSKLKYLAGSETGAGAFVADVAPEAAAARLREAAP